MPSPLLRVRFPQAALEPLARACAALEPGRLADRSAQREALADAVAAAPALGQALTAARDELDATGAVVLEGAPVSDAAVVLLAAVAGHATAEGNGVPERLVWDVRVADKAGDAIRSQRADAFALHTDSSDAPRPHEFVGLACVTPAEDGTGRSLLIAAEHVAETLRREYGDRTVRLLADACFPFAAATATGLPISRFAVLSSDLRVRYREPVLRCGLELADPPLDADHHAALEAFEDVVGREEIATHFRLVAGDVLLLDNRRVLHGRTRIGSAAGAVSPRHLKRVKLYSHDRAARA